MYDKAYRAYKSTHARRMFIHKSMSGNGGLGAVFFTIEGTPPKGYALYIPETRLLLIIDTWDKTRRYHEVKIVGIDDVLVDAIVDFRRGKS